MSSITDHKQNVTFEGASTGPSAGITTVDTHSAGTVQQDALELGNFFSRPVVIDTFTWTIGTSLFRTTYPWTLFFANKRISNRANNYKLVSGSLKIRFLINGNSFYYGRLFIDWQPLSQYDNVTLSDSSVGAKYVAVGGSQRLHVVLDPCVDDQAEMTLPIVWPYDSVDLTANEMSLIGRFNIYSLNTLKHANAGTGDVSISVMAWMDDVKLSIPTTSNMSGLTNQADEYVEKPVHPTIQIPVSPITTGPTSPVVTTAIECRCCVFRRPHNQADEYSLTPVAATASSISAAMTSISKVPIIGPYARMSSLVAGAVSSLASLFGFSKPANIAPTSRMLPTSLGDMATCVGLDLSSKLTVDPKQELSADPRLSGVPSGVDELVISHIASKESFYTQFAWTTANTTNTHLFSTRVSPFVFSTSNNVAFSPACSFAVMPFTYWRGMMRYRFEVVKSAHHKGRLAILWDPNYVTAPEMNIAYTLIVDLNETTEVVVDIPWGSSRSFLPVSNGIFYPTTDRGFSTTAYTTTSKEANGVLGVYVLTDLSVPNSVVNNDVTVNVYVSCIDLQVAVPNSTYTSKLTYVNQSDEYETGCDPVCLKECGDDRDITAAYYGESIRSFRQLLKRFSFNHAYYNRVTSSAAPDTVRRMTLVSKGPGYPRGSYSNGIHIDTALPVNITVNHLMHFLAPAFLCQRGGVRTKLVPYGLGTIYNALVTKTADASVSYGSTVATIGIAAVNAATAPESAMATLMVNSRRYTADGTAVTTAINPNLQFEVPHQTNLRFYCAKDMLDTELGNKTSFSAEITANVDTATGYILTERYIAAAEDYTLANFQGMPPWQSYGSL